MYERVICEVSCEGTVTEQVSQAAQLGEHRLVGSFMNKELCCVGFGVAWQVSCGR